MARKKVDESSVETVSVVEDDETFFEDEEIYGDEEEEDEEDSDSDVDVTSEDEEASADDTADPTIGNETLMAEAQIFIIETLQKIAKSAVGPKVYKEIVAKGDAIVDGLEGYLATV